MPPVRTMSAIKPMKTERTHEENQERAYIAASRRSDRSLEARVESARRASEIHKRRTGRSLRVTEQDVVNEEMYEEEDDDLPMQYRRLTAHLQTQNPTFNQRLHSYLSTRLGMRDSLGRAMSDQWMANNQMANNGFMTPGMMQMQQPWYQNQPAMTPDMTSQSPNNYRSAPYPMANTNNGNATVQSMRQNFHNRAASIATPHELTGYQQHALNAGPTATADNIKSEDRRMSLPVNGMAAPTRQSGTSPGQSSNTSNSNDQFTTSPQQHKSQQDQQQHAFTSPFYSNFNGAHGLEPLTPTLPMEAQQMLAPSFNMPDPLSMMFSDNSNMSSKPSQPFYSYNPNGRGKSDSSSQSGFDGLNQTLAPGTLDNTSGPTFDHSPYTQSPSSAATDMFVSPFTSSANYAMDGGFGMDLLSNNGYTSGHVTPGINANGEDFWTDFVDYNDQVAPAA